VTTSRAALKRSVFKGCSWPKAAEAYSTPTATQGGAEVVGERA